MDKQEIYNKVRDGLLAQNEKATNDEGDCVYAVGKLRCAAGFLLEGRALESNRRWPVWSAPCIRTEDFELERQAAKIGHRGFVHALQTIHDEWAPLEWKDELTRLALAEGLVP